LYYSITNWVFPLIKKTYLSWYCCCWYIKFSMTDQLWCYSSAWVSAQASGQANKHNKPLGWALSLPSQQCHSNSYFTGQLGSKKKQVYYCYWGTSAIVIMISPQMTPSTSSNTVPGLVQADTARRYRLTTPWWQCNIYTRFLILIITQPILHIPQTTSQHLCGTT